MGRGKLSLKLISSHKSRTATFRKRTKSLMKKAFELSTLCDVRTCVLIHGPAPPQDGDRSVVESHTWPPNREEIEGIIRAYKTNYLRKPSMKSFGLYDFFSGRMKKIEKERAKFSEEIKYAGWDERLNCLSEQQLRLFMDNLGSKIEAAEGMIGFMEGVSAIDSAGVSTELFEEKTPTSEDSVIVDPQRLPRYEFQAEEADYDHLIGDGALATDLIGGLTENQTPNSENSTFEGASAIDFAGRSTENQTPNSENSTIDSQWFPFHDGLQTEEALLMIPDHDFNLLFDPNRVKYTCEDLLSNNDMRLQSVLPLSYLPCGSDYSQMMNNASNQVQDYPVDYSDFEYRMMTSNF